MNFPTNTFPGLNKDAFILGKLIRAKWDQTVFFRDHFVGDKVALAFIWLNAWGAGWMTGWLTKDFIGQGFFWSPPPYMMLLLPVLFRRLFPAFSPIRSFIHPAFPISPFKRYYLSLAKDALSYTLLIFSAGWIGFLSGQYPVPWQDLFLMTSWVLKVFFLNRALRSLLSFRPTYLRLTGSFLLIAWGIFSVKVPADQYAWYLLLGELFILLLLDYRFFWASTSLPQFTQHSRGSIGESLSPRILAIWVRSELLRNTLVMAFCIKTAFLFLVASPLGRFVAGKDIFVLLLSSTGFYFTYQFNNWVGFNKNLFTLCAMSPYPAQTYFKIFVSILGYLVLGDFLALLLIMGLDQLELIPWFNLRLHNQDIFFYYFSVLPLIGALGMVFSIAQPRRIEHFTELLSFSQSNYLPFSLTTMGLMFLHALGTLFWGLPYRMVFLVVLLGGITGMVKRFPRYLKRKRIPVLEELR